MKRLVMSNSGQLAAATTDAYVLTQADINGANSGQRQDLLGDREVIYEREGDGALFQSDGSALVRAERPVNGASQAVRPGLTGLGGVRGIAGGGNANIGVAASGATGFRTIVTQHPAVRPFTGVWLRFLNYDTAAGCTLQAARVSSNASHLSPQNDNPALTWSALGAATVGGAALPFSAPAAVAGASLTIPAVFSTDRIAVTSVTRTDTTGGIIPLLRVAARMSDSGVYPNIGSTTMAAYNADAANPGFKYGAFTYSSGTDGVTTLGSVGPAESGGTVNPLEVVFDYGVPVHKLACFGDSNFQGLGTSGGVAGWPTRLMWLTVNDAVPASVAAYGVAGQRTVDSHATARAYMASIAATCRSTVVVSGWSPNDGANASSVFTPLRTSVLQLVALAASYGLPLWVTTTPPMSSAPAADRARVHAHNEWLRATMPGMGVTVFDAAALVSPVDTLLPAYNLDGTHITPAAHVILAERARALLTT